MFPQPELQPPAQPQPTFAAPTPVLENVMYKNDLHCYCQKLGIPLPVYQTAVEGCTQSIRFRSTVLVDTRIFTSANTFLKRKSAEQDAAKVALQHLMNENEARSTNLGLYLRNLVCQDKARCKMILHDFAVKIKAEYAYKTVQVETSSVFVSSLTLNSTCYNGEAGKNKKEAEQLAALAAILSLLDDLTYSATISEIIKSKFKSCAPFYEVKNFQNTRNCSVTNEDHKTTSLTNGVQQTYSRARAAEIIQKSIKLRGNNKDDLTYAATISEVIKSKFKISTAFYEFKNFQNTRNCSVTINDHKTTSLTNDVQMRLSEQTYPRADVIIQRSIKLEGNNDEQGGSKKLTDEHCGYGMVDEKPQELVNLQAKIANPSNFGVLDDKEQEMDNLQAKIANGSNFGVLDDKKDSAGFPIEAVTVSRSSYVPLPIISPTISEVIKSKFKISTAFYEFKNFQNTRNCSVTNNDHKTTSLTNDVQMHLSQQIHSRALADEIILRSIKLQGNNDEQGGSKKLTDEHCGYGMVDEKPQELVNLQAKIANCNNFEPLDEKPQELVNLQAKIANPSNFGVLDDKEQEMDNLQAKIANGSNFGVLDDKKDSVGFPIEAVTVSRSSYVPLPIISPTLSESQPEYKSSEAAMLGSVSQQNNIPKCVKTQDVTNNIISVKKRPRNKSKKRRMTRKRAEKRLRAETQVS